MSQTSYQLAGIGLGPFNLSLAALAEGIPELSSAFFEQKPRFEWHKELMLRDTFMQTPYLKDLVTPVDPTNRNSFLNYLVTHGKFYAFINTSRQFVTRMEFEDYCHWVSQRLPNTHFNQAVRELEFNGKQFRLRFDHGEVLASNICIGTGLVPYIPEWASARLSGTCFHAKSQQLKHLNTRGKRVLIIGGGQTGAEVFLNMLRGLWGEAEQLQWVSRRPNLEALDESVFTNEYFTPAYVKDFYQLDPSTKQAIVADQKLASDGITPSYLNEIYRELYRIRHIEAQGKKIECLPGRECYQLEFQDGAYEVKVHNRFRQVEETFVADIIVLCTGFKSQLPPCMESLMPRLHCDAQGRPQLTENFQINWEGPAHQHIYAVNFSRHSHGIAEPQTSLMAWRSATILNNLMGRPIFAVQNSQQPFLQF